MKYDALVRSIYHRVYYIIVYKIRSGLRERAPRSRHYRP